MSGLNPDLVEETRPGVWKILFEEFIPRGKLARFFFSLVLIKAISYWLIATFEHKGAPLSAISMYRQGDIYWWTLISALSRMQFGEVATFDHFGEGLRSPPFACAVPHAVLFRMFGDYGFIIGDILFMWGYYVAVSALLRMMGVRKGVAEFFAVLVPLRLFKIRASALGLKLFLYGWRIQRPFMTEFFFVLCMVFVAAIIIDKESRGKILAWAAAGFSLAFLAQGDMHTPVSLGIMIFLMAVGKLIFDADKKRTILGSVAFGATFAVCMVPFAIQRMSENPDVPRRYGMFLVDRMQPLFAARMVPEFIAGLVLCAIALWRISKNPSEDKAHLTRKRIVWFTGGMCFVSFFALPISTVILGRAAQIYHFPIQVRMLASFAVLVSLAVIADNIAAWLRGKMPEGKYVAVMAVVTIVIACVGLSDTYDRARTASAKRDHMWAHPKYQEWNLLKDYRANFEKLTAEFMKPQYKDDKIIATTDHQLHCWWLTYKPGCSYLGDPFLSSRPDSEIEERLIGFAKLVGMDKKKFNDFINRRYIYNWWWAHNKYQFHKAHCFAPMSDYTQEEVDSLKKSNIYDNWSLTVPISEKARMLRQFEETGEVHYRRPDVVVMFADPHLKGLAPPKNKYKLNYRNDTFTVWRRKAE